MGEGEEGSGVERAGKASKAALWVPENKQVGTLDSNNTATA